MVTSNKKLITLAIVLAAAVGGLLVGTTVTIEQVVIAQNMTGNMSMPSGNMSGTDNASGAISGIRG